MSFHSGTKNTLTQKLENEGYVVLEDVLCTSNLKRISRETEVLARGGVGTRNALEAVWCRELAKTIRLDSVVTPLLAKGLVAVQCTFFHKSTEHNCPMVRGGRMPNSRTFAVQTRLAHWVVVANEQTGVIETNWFPDHKGETRSKMQIVVWGNSYRGEVWQQEGWLFPSVKKTERSLRTERGLQDRIGEELRQLAVSA
jgi:hypothetical protein